MTTPTPCKMRVATRLGALGSGLLLATTLFTSPVFAAAEKPAAAKATTSASTGKSAKPKAGAAAKPKAAHANAAAAKKDTKKADARSAGTKKADRNAVAKNAPRKDNTPGPLADFGKATAPTEVVHVANWVSYTRNSNRKAFVVIDKKDARMYVFDNKGKLKSHSPVLLGSAPGDYSAPGIGNKPLSQIQAHERTTPAGRFWARPGKNNHGEDIIWIDYDAAVSMHRMRKVKEEERRADRMATPEPDDNRISNGCVNVPHKFYNTVLKPTVLRGGAYVYVLPETKTPQQMFGSFDVPAHVAAKAPAGNGKG